MSAACRLPVCHTRTTFLKWQGVENYVIATLKTHPFRAIWYDINFDGYKENYVRLGKRNARGKSERERAHAMRRLKGNDLSFGVKKHYALSCNRQIGQVKNMATSDVIVINGVYILESAIKELKTIFALVMDWKNDYGEWNRPFYRVVRYRRCKIMFK